MRSLLLLGLTGLAANVQAHPQRRMPHSTSVLSKRGVDLDDFRIAELSEYKGSKATKESDKVMSIEKAPGSYVDAATELVKTVAPGLEFRVVSDHYVSNNGIAHVNFKQTAHGIDVDNGDFNVNVGKDGKIFSYGNSFFTGDIPKESPLTKRSFSDPIDALKGVVSTLGLSIDSKDATAESKATEHYTLKGTSGTVRDPEAKLVYFVKDGALALTWRVETDVSSNWLQSYVDATDSSKVHGVIDFVNDLATYQVYPWGLNDPTEGERKVIEDPWLISVSEFTWESDGTTNYTTTRGNNAVAQNNPSGGNSWENNYRPDSKDLKFEYEYSTDMSDPDSYKDASITQLFYTANKYHDLLYTLGFTEEAGNFEANNDGKGGKGNDFAILNAQDGSGTNNANFATPPDGSNGQMRMFLWDSSTPVRDCTFEAGVVIHEFTHGLSTRLTGGPANSGCLGGTESGGMGEGWGDFMATAIRLKSNDTRATDYPMGAWVANEPKGIRAYPYSTSKTVNPQTYASANAENEVHAIGTIWANVLYEMLWNLIDTYGKNDADFPTFDSNGVPNDGKYLAMKVVIDGLALQPCNPTFISARDAILDADKALTDGKNACDIWTAFAKRGVGENAKAGASNLLSSVGARNLLGALAGRTEDFTVPSGVC